MSLLRWTIVTVLVLAVLIAASLTAEPSTWRETVQWARSYRDASTEHAATCPVLVGKPLPGNPRAAYDEVARTVLALDDVERQQLRAFAESRTENPEEALALAAKVPEQTLKALRQCARMDGVMFAPSNLGSRDVGTVLGDQLVMLDALLIESRHAAIESERVHAWLDVLACGWDLAGAEWPVLSMVGLMVAERAMDVADDQWLQELSPEAALQIRDALAKVDAVTPVCIDIEPQLADMVLLVDEAVDLQPGDIGLGSIYQAWQNGFSVEAEAIDRVSRMIEQVRAFRDATPSGEDWTSRRQRLESLVKLDKQCNSDMRLGYLGHVLHSEQSRRQSVAKLRVLRMALCERAGESLVLQDPLGDGAIEVAREEDQVRFFCAGGLPERRIRNK